ncbi:hypothetical protein ARAM_007161 [Aspergillus rambellii]|uniref:Protein kinase domain-containing protein n=1 Tax=Aspergillus rambellii TaxID=308745 RepID=A0A0F8VEB0_9EURO|nr:hypothetical protein ARAM_007161 [Aspergillus rambellii]
MASIARRFYTVVGKVTLEQVRVENKNGAQWALSVDKCATEEENADPKFKKLKIKGAVAHQSHKDPSDQQDVISLQFLDENENRIKTKHVHEDGTNIQAKNIIIASRDDSIFCEWENAEETDPSPRKIDGPRIVYKSRPFHRKKGWRGFGMPLLSDFGEARVGDVHNGLIQPDIYRAPEVILGMSWTSKVDIWNVGVLVWDLFEDHHLFDGRAPNGDQSDVHLLAEMEAMLGSPPLTFLHKSPQSQKYWNGLGQWNAAVEVPHYSLEESEEYLEGENKTMFLLFIRKMLQWDPEERQSAHELLSDPWLNSH